MIIKHKNSGYDLSSYPDNFLKGSPDLKKRAIEAIALLAAVIILFACINLITGRVADRTRKIDGEYYNISERELSLCLMTTDGTEALADFDRLERLTVTPYKYAAAGALKMGDEAYDASISEQAEDVYSDCTDLSDLSFLSPLTGLEYLNISECKASDLSFVSGMDKLEELDITGTDITDLAPLLDLPSLKKLSADKGVQGDVTDKLAENGVSVIFPADNEETEDSAE